MRYQEHATKEPLIWVILIAFLSISLLSSAFRNSSKSSNELHLTDSDHYSWLLHTEEADSKNTLTIHHINWDGGPLGRELHWASGLQWVLRLGAKAWQYLHPQVFKEALAQTATYSIAILNILLVITSFLLTSMLFSKATAGLITCSVYFTPNIVGFLRPYWIDHPNLLIASMFLFMLGILGMFFSMHKASSAVMSGIGAGFGVWISAVNTIPIFGLVLIGVAITIVLRAKHTKNLKPQLWLIWGLAASITSGAFYLVEYFPSAPVILEVNNPLYTIALFGTGLTLKYLQTRSKKAIFASVLILTPLIFKIYSGSTIVLSEPYFIRHMSLISEARQLNDLTLFGIPGILGIVVFILYYRGKFYDWQALLPFGLSSFILFVLSLTSARILPYCILSILFLSFTAIFLSKTRFTRATLVTILYVNILLGIIFLAFVAITKHGTTNSRMQNIRNTAKIIIEDAKANKIPIRLFTSIDAAPAYAYFTGGNVYGGPYWEGINNLVAGSKLYIETDDMKAERWLRENKIAYICIDDFGLLFSYPLLGETALSGNKNWFGTRLTYPAKIPQFLILLSDKKPILSCDRVFRVNENKK